MFIDFFLSFMIWTKQITPLIYEFTLENKGAIIMFQNWENKLYVSIVKKKEKKKTMCVNTQFYPDKLIKIFKKWKKV